MTNQIKNIIIIGTGNVATHLAKALSGAGLNIAQVYGRNIKDAREIAGDVNCNYTSDISTIYSGADLYILAVTETAVKEILEKLPKHNKLIVHTSGSLHIDILKAYSKNFGVLYPLQTFSKKDVINFSDIPFCIEANSQENLESLIKLAKSISDDVRKVNSEERKLIHLAAVFACNFPNFLYTIAEDILNKEGIRFDILLPLIKKTTEKIYTLSPGDVQTGPAQRKDQETIRKHMALLENMPEYEEIYKLLSDAIINKHH